MELAPAYMQRGRADLAVAKQHGAAKMFGGKQEGQRGLVVADEAADDASDF